MIYKWIYTNPSCQIQNVTTVTKWINKIRVFFSLGVICPIVFIQQFLLWILMCSQIHLTRTCEECSSPCSPLNCVKEKLSVWCLNFCDVKSKESEDTNQEPQIPSLWKILWARVIYLPESWIVICSRRERSYLQSRRPTFKCSECWKSGYQKVGWLGD